MKIDRKKFLKVMGVTGAAALIGGYGAKSYYTSSAKGKVVIVGGGAAGLSMAARLSIWLKNPDITLIDPSDTQYYQPGFTLIASGVYSPEDVSKKQADCIPTGVKWVKDSVVEIFPDRNSLRTANHGEIGYDFLVLTPGLQMNWKGVEGISLDTLGQGDAHCMYNYEGAIKTWQGVQKFVEKGGKGIYTDTYTKHKCGGAPKKICLLTEHLSRKQGKRKNIKLDFYTASKQLYDVPHFTPRLLEIYKERDVNLNLNTKLIGIDTSAKVAHMQQTIIATDGTKSVKDIKEDYDFIHFLPPMTAPDFVKQSGLSLPDDKCKGEGWVSVDKETLVHTKYSNIISFGDVAGVPTSKTSAAVRKQTPVAFQNLISIMENKAPTAKYNGYAACPIITDYGHVLLCEFDYSKKPDISFPFSLMDMSKESYFAWLLKVYALKPIYFYGMLNGIM